MGIATATEQLDAVSTWAARHGRGRVGPRTSDSVLLTGKHKEPVWVTPSIALAWALVQAQDCPPCDVGPCHVCSGEHGGKLRRIIVEDLWARPGEWRCFHARPRLQSTANKMAREGVLERQPWLFGRRGEGYEFQLACCRNTRRQLVDVADMLSDGLVHTPCVACSDSGVLLLQCQCKAAEPRNYYAHETPPSCPHDCPNCIRRCRLRVHADRLQAEGHPAGTTIALAMRWSETQEGTGEAVALLLGLVG